MNIYFVRHGDDDEKYRGGWSNLPLIQAGIDKAVLLGEYISKNALKFNLEKIVSSDLKRTQMTAELINKPLGLEIEYSEGLRENNNGELAGMLNEEAIVKYPNCFFSNLDMDERFPGGESPREFFNRVKESFYDLIEKNREHENILVVTHAGVIGIIYYIVNNIEWSNKAEKVKIGKTSINKLVINEENEMYFEYTNYMPHLNETAEILKEQEKDVILDAIRLTLKVSEIKGYNISKELFVNVNKEAILKASQEVGKVDKNLEAIFIMIAIALGQDKTSSEYSEAILNLIPKAIGVIKEKYIEK